MKWTMIAIASLVCVAAGQGTPQRTVPESAVAGGLSSRLAALEPGEPLAYFELAEEIATQADDIAALQLAERLYVLSFELARQGGERRLAASACLGLAELTRLERTRRWLIAVAAVVDPARQSPANGPAGPSTTFDPATGLRAAEVLGLTRAGRGREAIEALEDESVLELLARYDALLSPTGDGGGFQGVLSEARTWPDSRCFGERVVKDRVQGGGIQIDRCPHCSGNPGPDLSAQRLVGHLRYESHLLNGVQRSWSAQMWADGGAPLRDPSPDDLAPVYGIDASKSVFRSGSWQRASDEATQGLGSASSTD